MLRIPAGLLGVVGWVVLLVGALVASLLYHVDLPLTRRVVRDALNDFVSGEIRGTLHIGEITELGPNRVVARDVEVLDAHGRRVCVGKRAVIVPDLALALLGTLRFSSARAEHVWVRLEPGETTPGRDMPTFIESFLPAHPSNDGRPGLHAIVDGMEVVDGTVYGEVLGLRGLRMERVHARGRLEAWHTLEVQLLSVQGDVVRPFPFVAHVDDVVGRIVTDAHHGVSLRVRAHTDRDRIRARIGFAVPEDRPVDAPRHLDLLLRGQPVHPSTLVGVGFEWGRFLTPDAPVTGWFHLTGPIDDLVLEADVRSPAGPAQISAAIARERGVEISISTSGIELAGAVVDAPDIHVGGRAVMRIAPSTGDTAQPSAVSLDLEPFTVDRWAVPALRLQGALEEDRLRIDSMHAMRGGASANGSGSVAFDGSFSIDVRLHVPEMSREPNIHRTVPEARGSLDAALHLASHRAEQHVDFSGRVSLGAFALGPLHAATLTLSGRGHGDVTHPALRLAVTGSGVVLGGYPLGQADLTLTGGPRSYAAVGRFRGEGGRRVELDANVEWDRGAYLVDAHRIELAVGELVWRGSASGVRIEFGRSVSATRLLLANGSQRLEAHGTYRVHGPDELDAELQDFDLEAIRAVWRRDLPDFAGRADAHFVLRGDVRRPDMSIEGAVRAGRVLGVDGIETVYTLSYVRGALSGDAQVSFATGGSVALSGSGNIDPDDPDPLRALRAGTYDLSGEVSDLDLVLVRRFVGDRMPVLAGTVSGRVNASGTWDQPAFDLEAHGNGIALPGWTPLSLYVTSRYGAGTWLARVAASDGRGELLEAEGTASIPFQSLLGSASEVAQSLQGASWRMSVRAAPRPLTEWPEPVRSAAPYPLRIGASVTVSGNPTEGTGATVDASVEWVGEPAVLGCNNAERLHANVTARLRDGVTTALARGFLGHDQALEIIASAPTPVDRWLASGRAPAVPPVRATARMSEISLARLPYACGVADGPLSATVVAEGLFTNTPTAAIEVRSSAIRVSESPPFALEARADLGPNLASVSGTVHNGQRESAVWHGTVPIAWSRVPPVPTVRTDAAASIRVDLDDFSLAPVLVWVPSTANGDAQASGRITIEGTLARPTLGGNVTVHDGHIELVGLGQQLTDIGGRIALRGNWAQLDGWTASDGDGRIRVAGGIGFDGARPSRARLGVEASRFPARREGSLLATITGGASIRADITSRGIESTVAVERLAVRLPEATSRTLQALESHPDLVVVGEERPEAHPEDAFTVHMLIDASTPFWVRRNDFAALVAAELDVTYRSPDLLVGGWANVRRGYFDVFGKRFDVDRGSMNFDGGAEMNPVVDLQATHELRGRAGQHVYVRVTGTLRQPEIEFSTNVPDVPADTGSIIALLIGGQHGMSTGDSQSATAQTAGEQVASVLSGLTAGIATMFVRENLGEIVPVLVIESGEQGFSSARVRAGFQADSLIPQFMRGVVRGAYVEGIFTASGGGTTQSGSGAAPVQTSGAGVGFILELQFPENFVGAANYTPPNNFGLDFTWQP